MNIINKYRAIKNWIKSTKYGTKYIAFREKMLDQKLNRELIGEDRMGNKYYQYFSPWGLPTRREVIILFIEFIGFSFVKQPHFHKYEYMIIIISNKRQSSQIKVAMK